MIELLTAERFGVEMHHSITDLSDFIEIGYEDAAVDVPPQQVPTVRVTQQVDELAKREVLGAL